MTGLGRPGFSLEELSAVLRPAEVRITHIKLSSWRERAMRDGCGQDCPSRGLLLWGNGSAAAVERALHQVLSRQLRLPLSTTHLPKVSQA